MIYKRLADMDFANILFESKAQTQSGMAILNKYQALVMANPVTCGIVNNFIKEAKGCLYDNGVRNAYDRTSEFISESKYSWLLASTCEKINENTGSYNYLQRNAAKQVEKLLEMEEKDVVNYIKAGALKNVMFVEGFRNIVKGIQNDMPIVEEYVNFTNTHPISITEKVDDDIYFVVNRQLYKLNEGVTSIAEGEWNKVSNDFKVISTLLENKTFKFSDAETITYQCNENFSYEISEQGKCIKSYSDKKVELTVEQLREQNAIYLNTIPYESRRQQMSYVLEGLAKVCEHFDAIAVLNNVHIISTANDVIMLVESKDESTATLMQTNHAAAWSITDNIYKVCEFVKKRTHADISECFKEKIEEAIKATENEEKEQIQESIKEDEIKARKEKIAALTEKYKNDPTRLAVLSKVALELSDM